MKSKSKGKNDISVSAVDKFMADFDFQSALPNLKISLNKRCREKGLGAFIWNLENANLFENFIKFSYTKVFSVWFADL